MTGASAVADRAAADRAAADRAAADRAAGDRAAGDQAAADRAAPGAPVDRLRTALDRCLDALAASAVRDGAHAGWVAWEPTGDSAAAVARGGDPTFYGGDAGIGWACLRLARATGRPQLAGLGRAAVAHALSRPAPASPGLLSGRTGVALAAHAAGLPYVLPPPSEFAASDLTAGLAGLLLAQRRTGAAAGLVESTARALIDRAEPAVVGRTWRDPVPAGEVDRPLCGLAHGASGIALALAEAAAATGSHEVARAAGDALRWERLWFDPLRGWPDLRTQPAGHPAMWCHGAAGIGLARLGVLRLVEDGLDVGVPAVELRAEAQAAVGFCTDELTRVLTAARTHGPDAVPGGLTLCHGMGGPLRLLTAAARSGRPQLLEQARTLAAELVDVLLAADPDPLDWPAGQPQRGGAGLHLGLAGTALTLGELVHTHFRSDPPGR